MVEGGRTSYQQKKIVLSSRQLQSNSQDFFCFVVVVVVVVVVILDQMNHFDLEYIVDFTFMLFSFLYLKTDNKII